MSLSVFNVFKFEYFIFCNVSIVFLSWRSTGFHLVTLTVSLLSTMLHVRHADHTHPSSESHKDADET